MYVFPGTKTSHFLLLKVVVCCHFASVKVMFMFTLFVFTFNSFIFSDPSLNCATIFFIYNPSPFESVPNSIFGEGTWAISLCFSTFFCCFLRIGLRRTFLSLVACWECVVIEQPGAGFTLPLVLNPDRSSVLALQCFAAQRAPADASTNEIIAATTMVTTTLALDSTKNDFTVSQIHTKKS